MPLPANLELQTPSQKDWPLIDADIYQAEITDIEYKLEPNRFKKQATDPDEKQLMNFEFTIIEDGPFYGRKLWKKMSPTKPLPPRGEGQKSWIWRIASALAGHPLTFEEGDRFTSADINGFIHRQIRMTVSLSEPKDGKQYNNIDSFLAIKVNLPPFDLNKVAKENQERVSAITPAETVSGYEKARDVANSLPGANSGATDDLNVDDIPF